MSWGSNSPGADAGDSDAAWGLGAVFVGLGSNLGDARALFQAACDALRACARPGSLRRSSLWHTVPIDCPPGSPDFTNAVIAFLPQAGLTPEALLDRLQGLERDAGRRPKRVHNEARPLDLDLILFGSEQRETPRLTLPHPRAHLRRFVLGPLCELAPDLRPPGWANTAAFALAALPAQEAEAIGPW